MSPSCAGEHVYSKAQRAALGDDKVKPLARFDATELIAQRAEAAGKMNELQVQLTEAQKNETNGKMAKIGEAQSQLAQAQQQIKFLDHQIEECTVYSPIEGTVLTENVEQKRWSTPKKSEPLMDVASFSDWELVVDVPESEVATVRGALERATAPPPSMATPTREFSSTTSSPRRPISVLKFMPKAPPPSCRHRNRARTQTFFGFR